MNKSQIQIGQFLTLFLIILSFSFSALAQGIEKKESFNGINNIDISTISGNLTLEKSINAEVNVSVSSSYDENTMQMIMTQDGSSLKLKEKSSRGSSHGNSSWIVAIPDGMDIEVSYSSASGDLKASDIAVTLTINTASGDIKLQDVMGDVKGTTASGDIKLRQFKGNIKGKTASGDIKGSNIEGQFELATASGDVALSSVLLTKNSSFKSASGDVEISLNESPANDLDLDSASGNVTLNMQGNGLQGTLTMSTKVGRNNKINAPFEFDSSKTYDHYGQEYIEKSVILGNSKPQINLSTSSGDATIND